MPPRQLGVQVGLLLVYVYCACVSAFGFVHLCFMLCDLRTKQVLQHDALTCRCTFGSSSIWMKGLPHAWRRQWCGPVRTLRTHSIVEPLLDGHNEF
jgi:hypothetical protein